MAEYQNKMLNSQKKFVICNWKRGSGKTTALVKKILVPNKKILWVSKNNNLNYLHYCIKDIIHENIEIETLCGCLKGKIIIKFKHGNRTTIDFINNMNSSQIEGEGSYDWIIGDEVFINKECIQNNIKLKEDGQIICAFTDDELEYISDEDNNDIDIAETNIKFDRFIDNQIIKLSNEFEEYDNHIRGQREEILSMIERLIKLKRDYKEI